LAAIALAMETFVEALAFALKQMQSDCRERDPWVMP